MLKEDIKLLKNNVKEANELANEMAVLANKQELQFKQKISLYKFLIICMTILIIVAMTFLFVSQRKTTREFLELMYSAEIEDEEIEITSNSDNNGIAQAVYADNNSIINIGE